MMATQDKNTGTQIVKYVMHYIGWGAFIVSQLGLAIWAHELAITVGIIYSQRLKNAWLPRAVDMWSMVILGVILMITIFTSEAYLNKGLRQGRYWQRFATIALIEVVLAVVFFALGLFL